MREEYLIVGLAIFLVVYVFVIRPFRKGYRGEGVSKKAKTKIKHKQTSSSKTRDDDNLTSKEKGDRFEEFVVKRFSSEKFYKLMEWRGDKYVDGIFAESNQYPDLELVFKLKEIERRFAIECKYRSEVIEGDVKITYEDQLKRYKEFDSKTDIPVYMLLGLGGSSKNPSELFLIPISGIEYPYISYEKLKEFEKDLESPFYYNLLDETLH
jgi:hypothetical protein